MCWHERLDVVWSPEKSGPSQPLSQQLGERMRTASVTYMERVADTIAAIAPRSHSALAASLFPVLQNRLGTWLSALGSGHAPHHDDLHSR